MKKILILTALIFTLTIIFLACSEERDHASPFDPEYWSGKTIENLSSLDIENLEVDVLRVSWQANEKNPEGYQLRIDKQVGTSEWEENYRIIDGKETNFLDTVQIDHDLNYRVSVFYDQNISEPITDLPFYTGDKLACML